MSIADKLTTIAENEQKVYDKGAADGNNEMDLNHWKLLTNNGKRTYWCQFMAGQDYTGYTFPKPVKISGNNQYYLSQLFYNYQGTYLPGNIDLSGVAENTNMYNGSWFTWAANLVEIPDMGLPAINWASTNYCRSLKKIEVVRCNGTNTFPSFSDCSKLEQIGIEGIIGTNVSLSSCPLLTYKTLISIINALADYSADESGTAHKCSIGTANLAKLTEEEQQIAIDKGWTLS